MHVCMSVYNINIYTYTVLIPNIIRRLCNKTNDEISHFGSLVVANKTN